MPIEFDLSLIPTTIDAVHVGLAALSLVLLVIMLAVSTKKDTSKDTKPAEPAPAPKPVESLKEAKPDAALQLLGLLQQEARMVDFLSEDLTGFSDADIGATARVIHEGGKKVLNEYFELTTVRTEDEESQISIPEGFNAAEVRLTGNVVGEAPFNGVLIHKGWKVANAKLPKLAPDHDASIIAPAEVEL